MVFGNKEEISVKCTNLNFIVLMLILSNINYAVRKIEGYSWNTLGTSIGGIFQCQMDSKVRLWVLPA